jgi:hypothetical protein
MTTELGSETRPSLAARLRPGRTSPSAEDVAWVGLWPAALVLLAAIAWLAPPLSDLVPDPSGGFFAEMQLILKPEPLEQTRFLLAVAAPLGLAGLVIWLGSPAPGERRFDLPVIALQVGLVGLVLWAVLDQPDELPFVDPDYFAPLLLGAPVLVAGFLIGAGLLALALARRWPFARGKPDVAASGGWRWGALAVAVALTALWLLPAVFTDANLSEGGVIPDGHVPVQAQDYYAVANGRTPMVDYVAQYVQLLPLVFAPVLEPFDLSITASSVLMVALSVLALLAIYGVFLRVTERPLAALALYVPFLALALFPWSDEGLRHEFNGSYYAFFPGRYLGPFVVAWLAAVAVRGRRLPIWAVFFAAGLAMLNNAEFGTICVVAVFGALAVGADRGEGWGRLLWRLVRQAAIGLGGAVALVVAVVLVRTGELPDPGLWIYYTRLFAREGFGLEPMPALGLHIALYVTFVAAILTAAVRWVQDHEDRTLTAMLAFAGVFGLLAGSYFAGRSLPWQLMLLFPTWGLALALLTWAVLGYLGAERRESLRRLALPALATMVGFGVMIASIATISPPWDEVERLGRSGASEADNAEFQRFVEQRTEPGENVVIWGSAADHRLAERAGVENLSPFNLVLLLASPREVDRALDALEHAGGSKVFITGAPPGEQPSSVIEYLLAHGYRPAGGTVHGDVVMFERG